MVEGKENNKSLTRKVFHGGVWIFSLKVLSKVFSLVRTIILARLLAPKDFGLMGVVLLSIAFLYRFSQTGVGMALVQQKGDIEDYLDTAWIVAIARGLIMFSILFFCAPLIGLFFENSAVAIYLKIASFSPLILSLTSPRLVCIEKELKFDKKFIYEFFATIVDMVTAIIFAFILRNVWALVIGLIAGDLMRLVLSFYLFPYFPKWRFDIQKARYLYNFGKWIFINGILMFVIARSADILVGKIIGIAALGLYQMAFRVSTLVSSEIYYTFYQVTFPAYSQIQDNIERLRNAYLRVLQLTSIVVMPIAVITFAMASDFTILFLGQKWSAMIPAMQIFAFMALFSSLGSTFGSLYMSLGRADIPTKLQMVKIMFLAVLLYPLTSKFNIEGAAVAVLITSVALTPINIYLALKMINCKMSDFFKRFFISFSSSSVMYIVILLLKEFVFRQTTHVAFFIILAAGVVSYIGTLILIDMRLGYGYTQYFNARMIKKYMGLTSNSG